MNLKDDTALLDELSVEQSNSDDTFKDGPVSDKFVRESILDGMAVILGITTENLEKDSKATK